MFGGKEGYCSPEDIFAAALASRMNTLFLLFAKNSQLGLKSLDTKATVKINIEGMEKLIFTNVHFQMEVGLQTDNDRERKASAVDGMAQKICLIKQSWGGGVVPIRFKLNFK